jgi:FecR protein
MLTSRIATSSPRDNAGPLLPKRRHTLVSGTAYSAALAFIATLGALAAATALLAPLPAAAVPAPAQAQAAMGSFADGAGPGGSYGYLRVVEGTVLLGHAGGAAGDTATGSSPDGGGDGWSPGGSDAAPGAPATAGGAQPAQANQPVLTGDTLTVAPRARVEIVLADHNIVRLDGGTQVTLARLANSADQPAPSTELRLGAGNLQLIVTDASVGQEMPTVLTPNAGVYIQATGAYRVTTDRGDLSEVTVRQGTAQVVSDGGDTTLRDGQLATIDARNPAAGARQAGGLDALERWGGDVAGNAGDTRTAAASYVDPSLGYEAGSLDHYGHWLNVDDREYWQPNETTDSGWTPYWEGQWDATPAGMTWVSNEPWGWVPYHYGSWEYLPNNGWAWCPGSVFSPAWVYWYWGPSYAGWCPIGLYTGFYSHLFPAFRFGAYGWAGGSLGLFAHWHIVPLGHVLGRGWHGFAFGPGARALGGAGLLARGLERGLITTVTRGLTAGLLHTGPAGAMRLLASRSAFAGAGRGLPDVSAFIGRQASLPLEVAHAVAASAVGRQAGTPLAPRTLGLRPATASLPGTGARGGSNAFGSHIASQGGAHPASGPTSEAWRSSPRAAGAPGALADRRPAPARPPGRTAGQSERPGAAQGEPFDRGRTTGGTRWSGSYPAHPAPAQAHAWTGGSAPFGSRDPSGTTGSAPSARASGAAPRYDSFARTPSTTYRAPQGYSAHQADAYGARSTPPSRFQSAPRPQYSRPSSQPAYRADSYRGSYSSHGSTGRPSPPHSNSSHSGGGHSSSSHSGASGGHSSSGHSGGGGGHSGGGHHHG